MKRKAFALLAALVFGWGALAEAQTTITFWHWNSPERQQVVDPLIDRFEAETGIRVERRMVPWAELKEQLILSLAGGVAPDVSAVSSDWGTELSLLGVFADLGPFIERDALYDYEDIFPSAFELWRTREGIQYAFPFDFDISAVFYNRSIFDQAGLAYPDENLTWTSLHETAKRLTVDEDGDGQPDQYGFANGHSHWATYVWANGGDLIGPDGVTPTLNTPQAVEALEFWKSMAAPDVNMAWGEAARFGFPHPPAAFAGGKIAFYPLGAWAPSAFFRDTNTGRWLVDFDVTHMPVSHSGGRATLAAGQGVGVLATSDKKDAAFEFVKFMASVDVQSVSGSRLGQFPIRRTVALSDAFIVPGEPPANKRVFVEATAYARPYPKVANWPQAFQVMNAQVADFVAERRSLAEVLENVNTIVPAILRGDAGSQ